MVVRDIAGNFIDKDALAVFALATGQMAVGKIGNVNWGLDGSPPSVQVDLSLNIPITPEGLALGVLIVKPPTPPKIES